MNKAHPDEIPNDTRIRREITAIGESVWHIPASGKFGSFFFFGLIWITLTGGGTFAFSFGSSEDGNEAQPWFIFPFLAVFWAIGLGMLYAALRSKYARHQITVTRDLVKLRREMFGRVKEKSLVTSQVSSVAQVAFYQQNYEPVYGVEIRGKGGKLRFGTTLRDDEKAWLVAEIKRAVFGEEQSTDLADRTPEEIALQRQSSFSFSVPQGPKHQWLFGVIFLIMGLAVIYFSVSGGLEPPRNEGEQQTESFVRMVEAFFNLAELIPFVVGCVFSLVGLLVVFHTRSEGSRELRIEGDEAQVAIRTYKHSRVMKERSFPRPAVSGVRAVNSGHMNGKPMKRIELIVNGKSERLTRWTDGDTADSWVDEVSRALGI